MDDRIQIRRNKMIGTDKQHGSVLVLGAGAQNGLGSALARRFASAGYDLVVTGRSADKVGKIAADIEAAGGIAQAETVDVTNVDDLDRIFSILANKGPIAAVLYNAGNNGIIPFAELTAEQFQAFWHVGCLGGFHVAKRALPLLEAQGSGSLFFTGASASLRGRPNFAQFSVAKAGLRMLAQSLAREYGPKGIHVAHFIIDGVIDGEIVRQKFGDYIDRLGEDGTLKPEAIADTFFAVHQQGRSAWTHELDLRPFKEAW